MKHQSENEVEFFRELRALLERYDVDIIATDDDASYGQQLPLIQFQFNDPYGCYEFASVSSADDATEDVKARTS